MDTNNDLLKVETVCSGHFGATCLFCRSRRMTLLPLLGVGVWLYKPAMLRMVTHSTLITLKHRFLGRVCKSCYLKWLNFKF